ncbi:hypothetical protein NBRC116495_13500 [Aurantivibrio plasticivorans]
MKYTLKRLQCSVIFMVFTSILFSGVAMANDDSGRRRTAQILSMQGFKKVEKAQHAMQAEDWQLAIESLQQVVSGDRFSPFDQAKAYQLLAHCYISTNEYGKAKQMNQQALSLSVLGVESELAIVSALVSLSAAQEDYSSAEEYLQKWLSRVSEPDESLLFTAAQIYALLDEYEKAFSYSSEGIAKHRAALNAISEENLTAPRKQWFQMHLAISVKLQRYRDAIVQLQEMLVYWPSEGSYYTQLAGIYLEQEDSASALAVLAIAEHAGFISEASGLRRLAQLYRYHEFPMAAAKIYLSQRQLDKSLENDDQYWQALGSSYLQAKAFNSAQQAFMRAAELADHGRHWFRLCQSANREYQWLEAINYCQQAIERGGLEQQLHQAWQLLGMGAYQVGKWELAANSFEQCSHGTNGIKSCEQWAKYIELQQQTELRAKKEEANKKAQREAMRDRLEKRIEGALNF